MSRRSPSQPPRRTASTGARRQERATSARPQLIAMAGPAEGERFPLEGDEVVIGRAVECDVSVPDTSVSRRHAVVRKTDAGWAVSDLGSGNGTLLNGEALTDEAVLGHDDVITLGDTELRYDEGRRVAAVAPVRSVPRGSPRARPPVRTARHEAKASSRRPLVIAVAVALALLGFGLGFKLIDSKRRQREAVAQAEAQQRAQALSETFQKAKGLVKVGKFGEAREVLVTLAEEAPDFEPESVRTYLERCEAELPNERLLADAASAIGEGRIKAAHEALAQVKKTIQVDKKAALETKLEAEAATQLATARSLVASTGDRTAMTNLKNISEELLVLRPDDRELMQLERTAEQALARLDNPHVTAPIVEAPHVAVRQRYRQGDLAGAILLAKQCAARSSECKRLGEAMAEMQGKLAAVDGMSVRELRVLHQLDKQLSGGEATEQAKPARVRLTVQLYQEAVKLKTAQQWVRAIEASKEIVAVDPNHAGAKQILNEGRQQARQIYLRCYTLRESDPDEALRLCKEVLAISPVDDENHQKALARIQEIERR